VCKIPRQDATSHLVVKSPTHGSWSGDIVNRKPPGPGGGVLSINLCDSCVCVRQLVWVTIIVQWPHIIWRFQLQYVSVYLLIKVSPDAYTLVTPCSRVSILISIRVYISYEYTHTISIKKNVHFCMHLSFPYVRSSTSSCHRIWIYSVRVNSKNLNTCSESCVHIYTRTGQSKQNRIHVNKSMRNKILIYAYKHIYIKCT